MEEIVVIEDSFVWGTPDSMVGERKGGDGVAVERKVPSDEVLTLWFLLLEPVLPSEFDNSFHRLGTYQIVSKWDCAPGIGLALESPPQANPHEEKTPLLSSMRS